jgi:alpha-L-fucosidase
MKRTTFATLGLTLLLGTITIGLAQENASEEYMAMYRDKMERTDWWREARFGMFIHFGVYAVPARGEWVKSNEQLTTEEYQKYVDAFNPVDYDPRSWARLAKAAGMKYAVMTAKHHDGFCLFDSKYTDYDIGTTMPGRDLVREFLDAFRAEGLKVGLYYSLIDWHHPDYPNVGNHPMRDNEEWSSKQYDWESYLKYMHAQVEELVTRYGRLDIMWFDYSFDEYSGEKWKATELVKMVKKNQPRIILDNRLSVNPGVSTQGRELSGYGDFETPEQGIPEEVLKDRYGNPIPWETCLTLNNNWGYHATDNDWKSPETIVQALVNCVSKNGNLLLNVGPDARGRIPDPSTRILTRVGEWMSTHRESIYGCGPAEIGKPDWGRYTQKGNVLFAHWMYPWIGHINVAGVAGRTGMVTLLMDGSELPTSTSWWGNEGAGNFFVNVNAPTYRTFPLPSEIDTVIRIELKK